MIKYCNPIATSESWSKSLNKSRDWKPETLAWITWDSSLWHWSKSWSWSKGILLGTWLVRRFISQYSFFPPKREKILASISLSGNLTTVKVTEGIK